MSRSTSPTTSSPAGSRGAGALPILLLFALFLPSPAVGADGPAVKRPYATTEKREPCASGDPLRRAFFGDLHVHTGLSLDASTQGTRNTPGDAYRFARGERLGIQPYDAQGKALRSLQISRALDFAAVTDHAEMFGETRICQTPGLPGHDSWVCKIYRNYPRLAFFFMNAKYSLANTSRFDYCGPGGVHCLEAARTPWREVRDAAEGAYDRTAACTFTSFVAYEWTASIDTNNLHRNVIFRNERVPDLPSSFYEAGSAEELWKALRRDCNDRGDGCEAIVIPHNSNLSNGLIFRTVRPDGTPITATDARERQEMERLVEVMQHKGDSECSLGGGTVDEACAFEKLSFANFSQKFLPGFLAEEPDPRSFIRRALLDGLRLEEELGVNPFQFGLMASTDTHLGTPGAVAEEGHPGHGGAGASASDEVPVGLPDDLEFNPGGLAGIWAEENTRDALFAAMDRRETFGTSGPRIVVRTFGGWNLDPAMCESQDFAATGYRDGVPMGSALPPRPEGAGAPRFAVFAQKDPGTATAQGNLLQRVQLVKGWVENGRMREAVVDVAGGDNGASVDLSTCVPDGKGADSLCAVWRDPDFDRGEPAFYYVRVLENPSCRWSHYVCNAHAVDCNAPDSVPDDLEPCCDPGHRRTIRERAWTSPIWYTPPRAP